MVRSVVWEEADWSGAAGGNEVLSACQRECGEIRAGGAEERQVAGMARGQQGGDGRGGAGEIASARDADRVGAGTWLGYSLGGHLCPCR